MTAPALTTSDLFDAQAEALKLKWVAGQAGKHRLLEPTTAKFPGMALAGHLNFVHPNRIQVIGEAEIAYLAKLGKKEHADAIHNLFTCKKTSAVIVADK